MGSRVRENPKRLFEFFAEVAKPDDDTDPFILQSYPPDFSEQDVITNVTKFAFPCRTDGSAVDHFTFVLTDLESMYRFGFCRHATGAQTCLCIVSFLPWYEVFYNFSNHLAEVLNRTDNNDIVPLLRCAYAQEVPGPSIPVTIVAGKEMFSFRTPELHSAKLPSIPSSRNLTEYYNAVDLVNMMKIFAGMLFERRILITSKKLSRLTACIHGSEALLYPMHWQHLFIPVLPEHLVDYCSAPMPYLIGVHSSIMQKIRRTELGDAIIVDADSNTFDSEHDDLEELPSDVLSQLKKALKNQQSDRIRTSVPLTGDAISKAFLHALIKLIGGYRDALRFRAGEPITFEPEAFVQTRPLSMQPFLEKMLQLQIFQQFINERLDMLNCGQGFCDIFEIESISQGDKLNAQSRYKDWLTNMKKQGKKLQRGSKDVWSDLKKKLSSTGQKAYKGIKSKIGNLNKEEGNNGALKTSSSLKMQNSSKLFTRQGRPSTIIGPALKASRPQRPPPPTRFTSVGSDIGRQGQDRLIRSHLRSYKLLSAEEKSVDDTDLDLDYNRISINLVNDPDIQSAIRKSASMEFIVTHGVSKDSLSSTEQSSGTDADTTSELEVSGITLDTDSIILADPSPQRTSPQTLAVPGSPWQSPATQDTDRPIPAPRTKHKQRSTGSNAVPMTEKRQSPNVPAEKPLIKLESPEKQLPDPHTSNFDPLFADSGSLMSKGSSTSNGSIYMLENSPVISPPTRQSSVSRSHAFRETVVAPPKRQTLLNYADPELSSGSGSGSADFAKLFDPLANGSGQNHVETVKTSQVSGTHGPVPNKGNNSAEVEHGDLMQSWNIAHVTGGAAVKKLPPKVPLKAFTKPNMGPRTSAIAAQLQGASHTTSTSNHLFNTQAGTRNPVYFSSGLPTTNPISPPVAGKQNPYVHQSANQNTQSLSQQDAFGTLVDLTPATSTNTQNTSSKTRPSWEKFE